MSVNVTFTDGSEDEYGNPTVVGWRVYLPHQCDTWDISGDSSDGSTPEQAIKDLETFAADVQAALDALRSGQPYGTGDRW